MTKIQLPTAVNDMRKSNGLSAKDTAMFCEGPSLTRQEFAEECDINSIMKRYDAYLSDPMRSVREPRYYDFTELPETLMDMMDVLRQGEEAFYSLPALVRKEFDNDPAAFVDFAADPTHVDQMREWGLAAPAKPADKPLEVRVVPDPAPSSGAPGAGPRPSTPSST